MFLCLCISGLPRLLGAVKCGGKPSDSYRQSTDIPSGKQEEHETRCLHVEQVAQLARRNLFFQQLAVNRGEDGERLEFGSGLCAERAADCSCVFHS